LVSALVLLRIVKKICYNIFDMDIFLVNVSTRIQILI